MALRRLGGIQPVTSVRIPIEGLFPSAGAPEKVLGRAGIPLSAVPAVAFDAASDESMRFIIDRPQGWESYTIEIMWMNGGAGAGAVVWRTRAGYIASNFTLSGGSAVDATVTAGAQDVPMRSVIAPTPVTMVPSVAQLNIELTRRGTSGSDTLANDAHLIGVYLHRA